jgi:hypothetical protein
MDLAAWVHAHVGADVIVRLALVYSEETEDGEQADHVIDFDRVYEETGRLIGIVDGLLYLDYPTNPTSMPIPLVIAGIRERIDGRAPRYGITAGGGFVSAPLPFDPAHVVEIVLDRDGIGRQRALADRRESEEALALIRGIVATQPCCLCGRMVQPEDAGYEVVAPDTGLGEEGDPWYVPIGPTWRVVCRRHGDEQNRSSDGERQ